eukprot:357744-Chlamydomonas_euryale.AAC.4
MSSDAPFSASGLGRCVRRGRQAQAHDTGAHARACARAHAVCAWVCVCESRNNSRRRSFSVPLQRHRELGDACTP